MSEQETLRALEVGTHGAPMLLVEDDEFVADALTLSLASYGFSVVRCENAREALERLQAGLVPRLIVLDLWTPTMDGWQFRTEQRRNARWSEIPVIAMSGDVSPQATAIDAAAFLTKPINESVLLETIAQVLADAERATQASEQHKEVDLRNALYLSRGALHTMRSHVQAIESDETGLSRARGRALRMWLERAERLGALTEDLIDSGKPAASCSSFAQGDSAAGLVDVAAVLRHSLLRAACELPPRTLVYGDFAADTTVLADPRKLDHVFVNLLRNAGQAMLHEAQQELYLRAWHDEGDRLHVSVSDTGCGVPLDTHERIFDAFYSVGHETHTKGLGLAVARRMAEEMGGSLDVTSMPGIGSTFRLSLRREQGARSLPAERTQRPHAHILLIDDDAEALERRRAALSSRFVVSAMSMWPALQDLFAGTTYDLILCDATQNHLQGVSLYATLALRYPEQSARLVLVRTNAMERLRRDTLDDAAIWNVEDASGVELAEKLNRMIELWDSIGLRRPASSCAPDSRA